jgi:hypothetical protein
MKRIVPAFLLLLCSFFGRAQGGYSISISLKPFQSTYIYLGYYYGDKKAIADSAKLDASGAGVFSGKQPLAGGIYFIVSPKKEILFEVLIDKNQRFAISADTANIPNGVQYTNSIENTLFKDYTIFAAKTGTVIGRTNAEYQYANNAKDSAAVTARIKPLGDQIQRYRDSITTKYPNSLLAALFKAMREPIVPNASKHPGGKYDSIYAYNYFKAHYWDDISFTDSRLVRTPFFEHKLEKYMQNLVIPNPDSVIKEVDYMLLMARPSKEMYQYLLVHFVQKYINPQYMGQDAVFVHLFEKYVNTGQAEFFTSQYKEFMTKRAYSLMANLIGRPAADLDMVDSTDKPETLYQVRAELVVVCFWDPTCGHCKEIVPRVDSFFKAKWKAQGVALYGVMVDGGKENWVNFIKEKKLDGWKHVYQLPSVTDADNAAGRPSYRQLYDVYQTPMLYLLDKDKRIIAKKLTVEQLNEVIDMKLKNKKSN